MGNARLFADNPNIPKVLTLLMVTIPVPNVTPNPLPAGWVQPLPVQRTTPKYDSRRSIGNVFSSAE